VALIAGPYARWDDVYSDGHGEIPLGIFCRASLAEFMDAERLFTETKQGFGFYHNNFGEPYAFGKYDQLFVPEFNAGAMENAGAVTFLEDYVFRSKVTRYSYERRAETVLHEMAHMWFGDLVTMQWWDDLWLNESFAEWACYWCEAEATEYTDAWTGFTNARKQTGYRADQLPSTHPIAADNVDLHAVEVNFDMITYAKGASVLKQLVAWVGLDPFLAGLRQYFKDHEFGNATFADLLVALEKASGRELQGWAQEWLQTAGVNTLTPSFEVAADGTYDAVRILQTAAPEQPTLRRHRLGIGLYDEVDGRLVRREYLEIDVEGAETVVAELAGKQQPDLLLLNDADHAFAKIRLDERSLATVTAGLSKLDDSLARALVWSAAWDMTRDAEMSATDFVHLVLANIGAETDAWGVTRIPTYAALAVNAYSAPEHRAGLRAEWESGLRELLLAAEPGSDHQLTFARSYAAVAHGDQALADVQGLLDGTWTVDGLAVDQDLRWVLVTSLAAAGRSGEALIEAELERDKTIVGKEKAAAARVAQPTADAKAEGWRAILDPGTPNETHRETVLSIFRYGQEDVIAPYLERYLEAADTVIDTLGFHKASVLLEYGFPKALGTPALLERVDAWLAGTDAPKGAVRYVNEGRADVARALAAQERDAQG
jgi:aminopeptidase N